MNNNVIEINHSSIVINNYELGDCKTLERTFNIWNPTTHSLETKCIYYDEKNKKLYVPRGIDIRWLENKFPTYIIENNTNADPYDIIDEVRIKYLPRDDRQEEALKFLLGIGKYKSNKYKSQLCLNLNTGLGKTYCSIMSMSYLRMRAIMITYSINWIEQWRNFILEYTDIKPKEIFVISGASSIHSLLKKDMSQFKFILSTHGTIKSYGDKYGWDKVHKLFKHMKVGLKIFDEYHLNFENMSMIDYFSNTRQTFYVSATPARSDRQENQIFQYYFKNIPSINLFDKEKDQRTTYMAIRYNSRPTPEEISRCKNKYGLNRSAYTDYVVHKENFYKILKIILNIILKGDKKTLFYIGTNYGIEVVYNWMVQNYPKISDRIGIYNSTVPKELKREQLEKQIILSNTKSTGAASDIKGLKVVVVLAEPFKSEVLARQTLGRCRDKNTTYIEVVDDGFVYIKRFYRAKQKVFDTYASQCVEIKFSNDELDYKSSQIMNIYGNTPVPGIRRFRTYKPKENSGIEYVEEIV